MTFDENGICVLESIKSRDECDDYVKFLQDERERHRDAKAKAAYVDYTWHGYPLAEFYASAARRHQSDLDLIERRIAEIEAYRETL